MGAFKDLTGQKFGRLTVLERAENKGKHTAWRCRCDCGKFCVVTGHDLKNAHTKSCGCFKRYDLTGQKFGRLTVLGLVEIKRNQTYWLCRCSCGTEKVVCCRTLTSGHAKSCGCLNFENAPTHGMSNSKIYRAWADIKTRCLNRNCNHNGYKNYGGRGISMFSGWIEDFQAFYDYVSKLEHFGEKGYTLDRINNDGNYEPENVRWADRKAQQRNTRRNVFVEYQGKKMTLAEASEKSGINYQTLCQRFDACDARPQHPLFQTGVTFHPPSCARLSVPQFFGRSHILSLERRAQGRGPLFVPVQSAGRGQDRLNPLLRAVCVQKLGRAVACADCTRQSVFHHSSVDP